VNRDSEEVFQPTARYTPRPWPPRWQASRIIEVLEPIVGEERQSRIKGVLEARLQSVVVLMDSPHDPHNGAAVMRSADAFGVQEVHVVPRQDAFLASNLVARGAERWVDVIEHPSAQAAASALAKRGFELVATHPEGELLPDDLASLPKVALVLGNERDGISEELTQSAGRSVRVPMVGFVESLNVSVSAAILLHAATRGRPGDLDPNNYEALYAQGLMRSVKRASDILRATLD